MSKLATTRQNLAIGERLAAVRESVQQSQTDFALALGISPRAYQNYERGEREIPATVVLSLCEIYSTDPIWLLAGPGKEPKRYDPNLQEELLERLLDEIETRLQRAKKRLSPKAKARLIRLLYVRFRNKRTLDRAYVDDALALIA